LVCFVKHVSFIQRNGFSQFTLTVKILETTSSASTDFNFAVSVEHLFLMYKPASSCTGREVASLDVEDRIKLLEAVNYLEAEHILLI
jgi:hypothetical protein